MEHSGFLAVCFERIFVFEICWIIGQTGQVDLVAFSQVLDLVEGSDLIPFVGRVRDAMGEVENFHCFFILIGHGFDGLVQI